MIMKKTNTKTRTLLEIINEKEIKELLTVDSKNQLLRHLLLWLNIRLVH